MEYIDNYIDELFASKFESFKVEDDKGDKYKYLIFSFTRLNIYYLSAIIIAGSILTYTIVKNSGLKYQKQQSSPIYEQANKLNSNNSIENAKNTLSPENNKPSVKQPINQSNIPVIIKNNIDTRAASKINNTGDSMSSKNIIVSQPKSINQKDTIKKVQITNLPADTSQKYRVKKIKKVIVVKPKDVVIKDTVNIYKIHK